VVGNAPRTSRLLIMLKLSREYNTSLEFDELKRRLKNRVGQNFKLGILDNEEVNLYYLKDWYTNAGLDRIPFCEIKVQNHKQPDGQIKIRFVIADFALIIIALLPIIFIALFITLSVPFPFYYA